MGLGYPGAIFHRVAVPQRCIQVTEQRVGKYGCPRLPRDQRGILHEHIPHIPLSADGTQLREGFL